MTNNGCTPDQGTVNQANPGGYNLYADWYGPNRSDWITSSTFTLGNMDKLILSVNYSTDQFSSGQCPPGIQYTNNSNQPAAFADMNVAINQYDP